MNCFHRWTPVVPAIVILTIVSLSVAQDWGFVANGQGSPVSITADSSGNLIFAVYNPGGFWKSEDGGENWTPINDLMTDTLIFQCDYIKSVDPSADTLIAKFDAHDQHLSTGYHSYDGGLTWSTFDPWFWWPDNIMNGTPCETHITRHDPPRIYMTNGHGFAYSEWGNVYWQVYDIGNLFNQVEGMLVDPDAPATIYIYGHWDPDISQGGIIASYDHGQTWTRLTPMEDLFGDIHGRVVDMAILPDGHLIAACLLGYFSPYPMLLRSLNNGDTWEFIQHSGLPLEFKPQSIEAVPDHPGRLLMDAAWFGQYGLWRSDDAGINWEYVLDGLPVYPQGGFDIFRNPFSGDIFVGFHGQGIYRSRDDGDSWEFITGPELGVSSSTWSNMVVDETGFWQNGDNGSIWYAEESDTDFIGVEPALPASTSANLSPIAFPGDRIGYIKSLRSFYDTQDQVNIVWSDDGGTTWDQSEINTFDNTLTIRQVLAFEEDDDLLLVGHNIIDNHLYKSYDMGNTWEYIDFGGAAFGFLLQPRDQYYLWDSMGDIIRSEEIDNTWESTNFPDWEALAMGVAQPLSLGDTLYVQAEFTCWALLPDDTWQERGLMNGGTSDQMWAWDLVTAEDDTFFVAGFEFSDYAMNISRDFGWTWEEQDLEFPWPNQSVSVHAVKYDDYRQRLWIDCGVGLAYLDFAENSVQDPWVLKPAGYELLNAYPNPFNASTTIRFSLATAQNVKLNVYDILGRHVSTLADGQRIAGNHTVTFDASAYSSGTYYLRYNAGEITQERKLVLVK